MDTFLSFLRAFPPFCWEDLKVAPGNYEESYFASYVAFSFLLEGGGVGSGPRHVTVQHVSFFCSFFLHFLPASFKFFPSCFSVFARIP